MVFGHAASNVSQFCNPSVAAGLLARGHCDASTAYVLSFSGQDRLCHGLNHLIFECTVHTIFAIIFLGEKVGLIRWAAVLVGFIGVIMVMGLGSDAFTWDALLPFGAAALYALSGVTARLMDDDVSSALVNIYSTLIAVAGSILLTLFLGGFSSINSGSDVFWIITMGAFGGTAVLFLVISFRMTEQSNLAPFSYFGIPMAAFFGWLFFDETPFDDLFPGALLIIAGGLLVIWRERQLNS